MAFSPDAGFRSGALVVVATAVVVVARTSGGVVWVFADVVEHALKSAMTTTSPARRFTLWKLTGLLERSIGKCGEFCPCQFRALVFDTLRTHQTVIECSYETA
jgi:hypothetical protein